MTLAQSQLLIAPAGPALPPSASLPLPLSLFLSLLFVVVFVFVALLFFVGQFESSRISSVRRIRPGRSTKQTGETRHAAHNSRETHIQTDRVSPFPFDPPPPLLLSELLLGRWMSRSVQPKSPLQRGQQKREFAATTTTQAKRRKLTEQEAPNEMEIDPTLSTLHPPTHPHTQPATLHFNNAPLRRRAHSPVAKKKMVIKPFKVKPKLAESFESDTQAQLTLAVEAVYRKATIQMSQEELYRAVEAMCIHNKAPMIYANLFSQCDRHVAELLTSLDDQLRQQQQQQQQQQPHDTYQIATFLQQIQSVWSGHCDEMMTIRGIFLYLDRTYVIQLAAAHQTQPNHNNTMEDTNHHTEPPPKSIWDMGIGLFCTQLKSEYGRA